MALSESIDKIVAYGSSPAVQITTVILATLIAYFVIDLVYSSYLHPLAQFPGPAAAGRSTSWLFKASMTGHSQEIFEKLHEKYQTKALRIAPNELHISDVELYNQIYGQSEVFPKYDRFYDAFHLPHAVGTETDVELHKEQRRLLSPFYSRATLLKMEVLMHERAVALLKKITYIRKTQSSFNLVKAIKCHVFDVTVTCSFGLSSNLIEAGNSSFETDLIRAFDGIGGIFWKNFQWPLFKKIWSSIPKPFGLLRDSNDANFSIIVGTAASCLQQYTKAGNQQPHPVLFDYISSLPPQQQLSEAIEMLFAGADTLSTTLTTGILHILLNKDIERKLVDSLEDIHEDEAGYLRLVELEKVEYLAACVKESVRVGMGIPGRLPRVVPKKLSRPLIVEGKVVPPGTVVSMSAYTMNYSKELWGPDPRQFDPDRWLHGSTESLNGKMYSFSKGKRMCPGQNFTYAEMTIFIAYLFKNFKLRLPPGFTFPETTDYFAHKYPVSGVLVEMDPR